MSIWYFYHALRFRRQQELSLLHLCSIGSKLLPGGDATITLSFLTQSSIPREIRTDAYILQGNVSWDINKNVSLNRYSLAYNTIKNHINSNSSRFSAALALCGIAAVHIENGNVSEAADHLNQSISIYGNYSIAHSNLALCYCELGMKADAVGEIKRALEIEPTNRHALELLARIGGESMYSPAVDLARQVDDQLSRDDIESVHRLE